MTPEEQRNYVDATKKISTDSWLKPMYDDLIYTHRILFPSHIHSADIFLPWHRYFLLLYENLLLQADCRVNAAYWDWSVVSDDPWGTNDGDVWSSSDRGFGGNGTCLVNEKPPCCVRDGPFKTPEWRLVPGSVTECLTRSFADKVAHSKAEVDALLEESNFTKFEDAWRTYHNEVHCSFGGTMCTSLSQCPRVLPPSWLHRQDLERLASEIRPGI